MTSEHSKSDKRLPAALLAEALLSTTNRDLRGLRVSLTHFMPPVVVSTQAQISITTINQTMSYLSNIGRGLGSFRGP